MPEIPAIIVAGGSSRRMGFDKILAPLAGRTVLAHSLAAFENCAAIGAIVVVGPAGRAESFDSTCMEYAKVAAVVDGGAERVDSVAAGLEGLVALGFSDGWVAVHDAARPLVTAAAIDACCRAAVGHGAAALAEPAVDTLHRTDDSGMVVETLPRTNLWRAQTPQILPIEELIAGGTFRDRTDEVALRLASGNPVVLVDPCVPNFKITRPGDLAIAEAVLTTRNL
jgi:2-C-methyl-D-erythritol 4-phosphate cytidylyltransferase